MLDVHQAADGGLARLRIPGGLVSARQWRVLVDAAQDVGDGGLQLTSRGNVEIRGLAPLAEVALARSMQDAGLLPSSTHERVRNIVLSPLSGLDHRRNGDVSALVPRLDACVQASPALAELSGRFLFGLDDGRGDVIGLAADLTLVGSGEARATLLIDGHECAITVDWSAGPALLVAAAEAFLSEALLADRSCAWRVAELPGGAGRVAARLGGHVGELHRVGASPPLGFVGSPDGTVALVVAAPFGRFTHRQADLVAGASEQLRLTPWRSVVLPGLSVATAARLSRALRVAGLAVDNSSPWRSVTACTGRPGCAKALADVRADAAAAVRLNNPGAKGSKVHWSGCERRCGHPRGDHVDVLATSAGYQTAQL